jgi:hypothetical protein
VHFLKAKLLSRSRVLTPTLETAQKLYCSTDSKSTTLAIMSIKSLITAFAALAFAQQVSALAVIGDRFPTSPRDLERRANYQCNVYSDFSCNDFIGSSASASNLGQCASSGGSGNSYLCFNVNDVEQVDFFYGSNCEDATIITSEFGNIGCTPSPQTIRSLTTFGCNNVDGSEC